MKLKALLILLGFTSSLHCLADDTKFEKLLSKLERLSTPEYTGGLTKKHTKLANNIVEQLRANYPKVSCPKKDPLDGDIVGLGSSNNESIKIKDIEPKLRRLVQLLKTERQELRDTATYILAEMGPSVKSILPILVEAKAERDLQGNWYNYALTKVSCQQWTRAHYSRVIPKSILPAKESWQQYKKDTATILINLYLKPDLIFPPGTLYSLFEHSNFDDSMPEVEMLLLEVVSAEGITKQKKLESLRSLQSLNISNQSLVGERLASLEFKDEELSWELSNVLIKVMHPLGIGALEERIIKGYHHWVWSEELCSYGAKASSIDRAIIKRLTLEPIPETSAALLRGLGCLQSKAGIKVLEHYAKSNDWQIQKSAIEALGHYKKLPESSIDLINDVYGSSWSKQVRDSAFKSLVSLGEIEESIPNDEDQGGIVIRMGPHPIDHGLKWCDESGRYSLNGSDWFWVEWQTVGLTSPPQHFPEDILADFGSRAFLRVNNGWLYGSDLGHYDGDFLFWSESGELYDLSSYADIKAIISLKSKIIAFGYETLVNGDAGSLFELEQNDDGKWVANRILTLPSPPNAYSVTKNDILLLSDGPNDYAVIGLKVQPLLCEKEVKGNYFK